MALALRQPIHITREVFNFEDKLKEDDLEDDSEGSGVYNKDVRQALVIIAVAACDLACILTDILNLAVPQVRSTCCVPETTNHHFLHVKQLRETLKEWCSNITSRLSGMHVHRQCRSPTTFFSHLLLMQFNSALVMLAHSEIEREVESHPQSGRDHLSISQNRLEISESTASTTEILRSIAQIGMLQYLPVITHVPLSSPCGLTVAFTAQPLALLVLDQTFTYGITSAANNELQVMLETMKAYQPLYSTTDVVLETTYRIGLAARAMLRNSAVMP
ncbi:hypothetical protein FE257_004012 [Aspergillus nanangensis]|uniref:Uncharacterized protein n=1 Tax=Aspergillus nanangensis TaxID=2582783 RepID=A0AAD4CRU2_ASPNN|nr:hypothetical protein FE257_004012 [Aspergillus nanangensis]